MFNAADLAEAALRLGLHGLADQRASVRRSAQFSALAPRLIASLTHV
jgi:hypothetical protein